MEILFWAVLLIGALLLEVLTLTIYLLAVAFGALVALFFAYFGAPLEANLLAFTVSTFAGTLMVRRYFKPKKAETAPGWLNAPVTVVSAQPDGRIRVAYSGTEWDATLKDTQSFPASVGQTLFIHELKGNRLTLSTLPSHTN